jgi:hypothetical protein
VSAAGAFCRYPERSEGFFWANKELLPQISHMSADKEFSRESTRKGASQLLIANAFCWLIAKY